MSRTTLAVRTRQATDLRRQAITAGRLQLVAGDSIAGSRTGFETGGRYLRFTYQREVDDEHRTCPTSPERRPPGSAWIPQDSEDEHPSSRAHLRGARREPWTPSCSVALILARLQRGVHRFVRVTRQGRDGWRNIHWGSSVGTTERRIARTGSSSGSETSNSSCGGIEYRSRARPKLIRRRAGRPHRRSWRGRRSDWRPDARQLCESRVPRADRPMEAYVRARRRYRAPSRTVARQAKPIRAPRDGRLHNLGDAGSTVQAFPGRGREEDSLAALGAAGDACEHPELADAVFLGTGRTPASSGAGARPVEAFPQRGRSVYAHRGPRGWHHDGDATSAIRSCHTMAPMESQPRWSRGPCSRTSRGRRYADRPMWGVGYVHQQRHQPSASHIHQFLVCRYPDHLDAARCAGDRSFDEADGRLATWRTLPSIDTMVRPDRCCVARASDIPGMPSAASCTIDAFVLMLAGLRGRSSDVRRIVSPQAHHTPRLENPDDVRGGGRRARCPGRGGADVGTAPRRTRRRVAPRSGGFWCWASSLARGASRSSFEGVVLPWQARSADRGGHSMTMRAACAHPVTVQVVRAGCPPAGTGYQVICVAQ